MKKRGLVAYLFIALAILGMVVLVVYGRVLKAVLATMGDSAEAKQNKLDLDGAIADIEARQAKK